jgi:2-polyprenyl-3-methyl-5-hydroxy-6-metoxy-1,4-benzoquinol methylase
MHTPPLTVADVEAWNDAFARENDIDEYYSRSGCLIRWIERRRLAMIRRMTAAQPGCRILEVGCGGGHVLQLFPECDLTGVDVSGEMLRKAEKNLRGYRLRILKGELHQLGLSPQSFDHVICSEVLEHVTDPLEVLSQIKRLLRPDGRVVVTLPNDALVQSLKSIIRASGLAALPPFRRISWGGDRYHLHQWRPAEMHSLLSRFFTIRRTRYIPSCLLPIRCCFQCTVSPEV